MTTDNLDPDDYLAAYSAFDEYAEQWRPEEGTGSIRASVRHAHVHGFAAGAAYITRTQCVPLAAELAKATRQSDALAESTEHLARATEEQVAALADASPYANGGILSEGTRSMWTREQRSEYPPIKVRTLAESSKRAVDDAIRTLGRRVLLPVDTERLIDAAERGTLIDGRRAKIDPASLPRIRHPFTTNPKPGEQRPAWAAEAEAQFTADPEKWREEQIVHGSRVIADRLISDLRGVQLTAEDAERVERVLRSRIRADVAPAATEDAYLIDAEKPAEVPWETIRRLIREQAPLDQDGVVALLSEVTSCLKGDGSVVAAVSDEKPIRLAGETVTQEQFAAVRDHLVKQLGGAAL